MALIACTECGREISDRAVACPHCGAPRPAATALAAKDRSNDEASTLVKGALWLGAIAAVLLFFGFYGKDSSSGQMAAAPAPPRQQEPPPWQLTGQQGDMRFVLIPEIDGSQAPFHQAVTALCAGKTHCFVNFWGDASLAPTRLPLSDAQVSAQVAGYRLNTHTGLSKWAWRCDIFPKTPPDQCF